MKIDIDEKSLEEVLKLWLGIALVLGVAALVEIANFLVASALTFFK